MSVDILLVPTGVHVVKLKGRGVEMVPTSFFFFFLREFPPKISVPLVQALRYLNVSPFHIPQVFFNYCFSAVSQQGYLFCFSLSVVLSFPSPSNSPRAKHLIFKVRGGKTH